MRAVIEPEKMSQYGHPTPETLWHQGDAPLHAVTRLRLIVGIAFSTLGCFGSKTKHQQCCWRFDAAAPQPFCLTSISVHTSLRERPWSLQSQRRIHFESDHTIRQSIQSLLTLTMAETRTPGRATPGRRRNANKENIYFEPGKFGRYGRIRGRSRATSEERRTDVKIGKRESPSRILESATSMDLNQSAASSRRRIALRQFVSPQSARKQMVSETPRSRLNFTFARRGRDTES